MRKQLAAARTELSAQAAARQDLQAQLSALQTQQADLNTLRQQVELLRAEVKGLKANTVLDLNGYLTFDVSNGYPTALFRGINVQIVNGTGDTQTINGMGNLIVGYNRPSTGSFICSIGSADSEAACAGKRWRLGAEPQEWFAQYRRRRLQQLLELGRTWSWAWRTPSARPMRRSSPGPAIAPAPASRASAAAATTPRAASTAV